MQFACGRGGLGGGAGGDGGSDGGAGGYGGGDGGGDGGMHQQVANLRDVARVPIAACAFSITTSDESSDESNVENLNSVPYLKLIS